MQMKTVILAATLAFSSIGGNAIAAMISVSVDTSPIEGSSGFLAFNFIDGDGVVNNQVVISDFATNGTRGDLFFEGGANGSLIPGPLVIDDSELFNEALQEMGFGSSLSFRLEFTTEGPLNSAPDQFSFFLLDADFFPFATSDVFASALFIVDIVGEQLSPEVFVSDFATVNLTETGNDVSVPEPSTFAILALGLFLLGAGRLKIRKEG